MANTQVHIVFQGVLRPLCEHKSLDEILTELLL